MKSHRKKRHNGRKTQKLKMRGGQFFRKKKVLSSSASPRQGSVAASQTRPGSVAASQTRPGSVAASQTRPGSSTNLRMQSNPMLTRNPLSRSLTTRPGDGPDRPSSRSLTTRPGDGPDRPPTRRPTSGQDDGPDRPPPRRPTSGQDDGPDRPPTRRPTSGQDDGPDRPPTRRPTNGQDDGPDRPTPTRNPRGDTDDGPDDGPDDPLARKRARQDADLEKKQTKEKDTLRKKQDDEADKLRRQQELENEFPNPNEREAVRKARHDKEREALQKKQQKETDNLDTKQTKETKTKKKKQEDEEEARDRELRKTSSSSGDIPNPTGAVQTGLSSAQLAQLQQQQQQQQYFGGPGAYPGMPLYLGGPGGPGAYPGGPVGPGFYPGGPGGTNRDTRFSFDNSNSNNTNENGSNGYNSNSRGPGANGGPRANGGPGAAYGRNSSYGNSRGAMYSSANGRETNAASSLSSLSKRGIFSVNEGVVRGTIVPGVPLEIEYEEYTGPKKPFIYKIPLEKDAESGMLITQFSADTSKGTRFYLLYGISVPQIEKIIKDFAVYQREVDSPKGEFITALRDTIIETKSDLEKVGSQASKLLEELDDLNPDERPKYAQVLQILEGRKNSLEDALSASIRVRNSGVK